MYSVCEQHQELATKFEQVKKLSKELLALNKPIALNQLVGATPNFLQELVRREELLVVHEGVAALAIRGQTLLVFESDDILWPELSGLAADATMPLEFAIRVDSYPLLILDPQSAISSQHSALFNDFYAARFQLMMLIAGLLVKGERGFEPVMRWFEQGEVIIQQGGTDNEVYTLVQGDAHAYVNNIQVGSIGENEIFGALAALTGTPRTAQVVAASRCMVLILPKEKFLDLMNDRPSTVLKLVEDMAKTIMALNDKVVKLSGRAKNLYR